ncbi:helix-hairpin-helix domain-containing protein [Lacrimispora sp.]|uniref:helix-hairpin-helix domain-containing protein n=1 Tax=Lacrimispora sp. TaxID=2719234 RepID=UPI002FDAB2E3
MKYQKIKIAVIVFLVVTAGLCYGLKSNYGSREKGLLLTEAASFPAVSGSEEAGGRSFSESEGNSFSDQSEEETLPACYVHICGEVAAPGVYELEEGSRVFQAVEMAGGFTEKAAPEYLNMAEKIHDGMKITVLSQEEARAGGTLSAVPGAASQQKSKINLNTATKEQLMTLRGVGEAKAADIIKYRESHGGFQKIEDIMKISGIKEAAFQKIKDDITV